MIETTYFYPEIKVIFQMENNFRNMKNIFLFDKTLKNGEWYSRGVYLPTQNTMFPASKNLLCVFCPPCNNHPFYVVLPLSKLFYTFT